MAWARVQSKSVESLSVTSLTVTLTSTPTTGNKIIVVVAVAGSTLPNAVKDNAGAGASLTQAYAAGNGSVGIDMHFYDVPATPQTAFQVAVPAAADMAVLVQEVSGLLAGNTTACLDGTPVTVVGTTSPAATPAYSSTAANEYLTTTFADFGNSAVYTVPAGYTGDANGINTSATNDLEIAYKNSSNGAESSSWSYTTTGNQWGVGMVAFKLAAGGAAGRTQPPIVVSRQATVRASTR